MKNLISTTRKLLFLVTLLALLFTVFSSTASAHNVSGVGPRPVIHNSSALQANGYPCDGQSCYNQDPYTYPYTLCSRDYSNPRSVVSGKFNYATLWNVWSSSCHANWVEAQLSTYSLSANLALHIDISDKTAPSQEQCFPTACSPDDLNDYWYNGYQGPYVAWSNMIDGYPITHAVVNIYTQEGSNFASWSGSYDR